MDDEVKLLYINVNIHVIEKLIFARVAMSDQDTVDNK